MARIAQISEFARRDSKRAVAAGVGNATPLPGEHRARVGGRREAIGAAEPSKTQETRLQRRPVWEPTPLQLAIAEAIALCPDTWAFRKVRHFLNLAFWAADFARGERA